MSGLLPSPPPPGGAPLPIPLRPKADLGADTTRRAERFVLRSHIVPLLDVLLENRGPFADVMSGRTHAGKFAARVLIVRKLIERDASTRPCFGPDPEISRQNGTNEKIKDILRVLRTRYEAVCALADDPTSPPDALRRAMESFAGLHYDEAKRKADALFRAPSPGEETESGFVSAGEATDDSAVLLSGSVPSAMGAMTPIALAGRIVKKRAGKPKMNQHAAAAAAAYLASADPVVAEAAPRVEGPLEAQMRAALVEERLKQARTKFGIEIFANAGLPANVRVMLLRKHGCDELADALEAEEHGTPLC